jgi:CheY-like chemotaxis protein
MEKRIDPGNSRIHAERQMSRILIIDDDHAFRAVLERMLKSANHEVILAADGDEGLNQLKKLPPALVITDLFMPNKDGIETIIHLRKIYPVLPIIAISGKPAGSVVLSVAKKLGAAAVLEKPFSIEDLLTAVDRALAQ